METSGLLFLGHPVCIGSLKKVNYFRIIKSYWKPVNEARFFSPNLSVKAYRPTLELNGIDYSMATCMT